MNNNVRIKTISLEVIQMHDFSIDYFNGLEAKAYG